MLIVPLALLALGIVGVCLLVYFKLKHTLTVALFVKVGVSILFILLAAWGATRSVIQESGLNTLAFFIMAGLTMGLLGDIWLDQKSVHKDYKRVYMYAGFSSFGIGHIFYFVGLFITLGKAAFALLLWPVAIASAMAVVMYLIEKPLRMDYGEYRPIIMVYTFIITATAVLPIVLSLGLAQIQSEFTLVFSAGMVFFLLSDLVLSQSYFSQKHVPEKIFVPLNYLLYYGGQFAIASSLLTIVPL